MTGLVSFIGYLEGGIQTMLPEKIITRCNQTPDDLISCVLNNKYYSILYRSKITDPLEMIAHILRKFKHLRLKKFPMYVKP